MIGPCRCLGALVLAIGLASAMSAQPTSGPPDVPAGPAAITGQVLMRTGRVPVPGAEVALYALTAEGVPGMRRGVADADGRFRFDGLSDDPSTSYLVGARHAGVPYPGGRVQFTAGTSEQTVEILVNDITPSPEAVALAEARFRVMRDPFQNELRVRETLVFENRGQDSYHVASDARAGAQPAAEVELPSDAGELTMPLGVTPDGLVQDGLTLRYFGPIHPGQSELVFGYVLPLDGETARFAPQAAGAEAIRVWVAADVEVRSSEGLVAQDDQALEGGTFRAFASTGSPGAEPVSLVLAVPPAQANTTTLTPDEVRFVLHADDAAIDVTERHTFTVPGAAAVRSTGPDDPLLRIAVPESATGLRFGTSGGGLLLTPHAEGGLAVVGTAPPGENSVEIAYRVPVTGERAVLAMRFAEPTPLLSIYVADTGGLAVESERLHRRRPVGTADLTYMHFEAFEIARDEEVVLSIASRPPRHLLPVAATRAVSVLIALAVIWALADPLQAARGGRIRAIEEDSVDDRERGAIYASIQALDHDFETGKLSEADHVQLRGELRARAIELLKRERDAAGKRELATAADPNSAHPEGAAVGLATCAQCGGNLRAGDRFCSQCGAPIGVAGA